MSSLPANGSVMHRNRHARVALAGFRPHTTIARGYHARSCGSVTAVAQSLGGVPRSGEAV